MSFNFNTNGNLFCEGETFVIDGANKLKEIIDDITSIKIPSDFDKNSIFSLKDNLNASLKKVEECLDQIYRTKEKLLELDNGFYESYMSSFNSNNTLSKMNDNEQLNFMDYLMHLVESYDSLDENTKYLLMSYFGEHITKVNYSGIFKNFTDFQNINMSYFSNVFYKLEQNKKNVEGKTIKELLCTKNYKNNKDLEKLYKRGYGDIKISEIIRGEKGFSAVVLQDKEGNYMINFNCTETEGVNSVGDYLYDAALALNTKFGLGARLLSSGLGLSSLTEPVIGSLSHEYVGMQREQARILTKKYINSVNKTSKKISISGYSLGGSLAEEALLCCSESGNDCVEKVVLFNPIHNALSEKDVQIIKSYGEKYQCYAAQGDIVSALSNYDDLKDLTRYIGYDYESKYSEVCKSVKNHKLSYLDLIVGPTHSFGTVSRDESIVNNNFDKNGRYKFGANPVSFNECLKTLGGGLFNE